MQLIIKVCGMTQADNIREVESLGVDWMGFICYPPSPRHVAQTPAYLPSRAKRVGVFVNATDEWITENIRRLGLHMVQLHGDESPPCCRRWRERGVPVVKAFAVATADDLQRTQAYEGTCDYFLFDTKTPLRGGSGNSFDWQLLQAYRGHTPFLLSGGIGPDSVQELLALHHPQWAGIDLNSRFESAPGLKEPARLNHFINQLKSRQDE